ncbi:MAG: 30S ribosomal protein S24e [Sulfolobaceae archaeon]|nr:30S ribosomal protein S24e [Sulfolobaceae archaeon]
MSQGIKVKVSDKIEGIVERETQNKVANRKEISVKLFHIGTGTPSRKEIKKAIAAAYNVGEDQVVVRKVSTVYGSGISLAKVNIYANKEDLAKYEPKYILDRDAGTKQKKGGGKGGKAEGQGGS